MDITRADALRPYLPHADFIDHKTSEGDVSLRHYLAGMLAYSPAWLKGLYVVRAGFVRLLGMRQRHPPDAAMRLTAETLPFEPGARANVFVVEAAREGAYWVGSAADKHLIAYLGVVVEPIGAGRSRFHTVTIVHYRDWSGPVYFAFVRPFHHLVVRAMMQAGIQASSG